jgi:predicted 3-demethylubiquinone-9 3-methyltransferase (glyoxalase superfamily)
MSNTFPNINPAISPCLWCKDNALEKAEYYCSIFPNSKILTQHPLIIAFELNGVKFQALNGGVDFTYNESISLTISCKNQEEVDHYWNSFINDGGKAHVCGWCQDKYGMWWQVVPSRYVELMLDSDPVKSGRVTQAIMKMQKIVIADLESAYNQESDTQEN